MAGERTEAPTQQRREELHHEGRAPRSTEVQTAAVVLGMLVALQHTGPASVLKTLEFLEGSLRDIGAAVHDQGQVGLVSFDAVMAFFAAVLPLLLAGWAVGAVVGIAQSGLVLTTKPMQPDFSRLNPLSALKRWFSSESLVQLCKDCIKLSVLALAAWRVMENRQQELALLPRENLMDAVMLIADLAFNVAMQSTLMFLALSLFDYGYQRWKYEKSIKMTKQEVRDSMRQTEGDPQTKNRIRAAARKLARGRQLQAVPQASVVIVNPTHLAIALEYDGETMAAPRILAKGERILAQKIRSIAEQHNIPIVTNPPLAWAIHGAAEVGDYIPSHLYAAVAEVLAFVFSLKARRRAG